METIASSPEIPSQSGTPKITPPLSLLAIAGAAWTPFFVAAILCITLGQEQFPRAYGGFSRVLLFLALAAPLVTTIFGWLAVVQIRRSGGNLPGLALALFDGLLFPLLGLDVLISLGWLILAKSMAHWRGLDGSLFANLWDFAFGISLLIIVAAAADFLIARRLWRWLSQPPGKGDSAQPHRPGIVTQSLAAGLLTSGLIISTAAVLLVACRNVDNVNQPFADDPQVIGNWNSVDFVGEPEDFKPGVRCWPGNLVVFQNFYVYPGGRTSYHWLSWTKDAFVNPGEKTAGKYEIRDFEGTNYLFVEWKNADYILFHAQPRYFVLQQTANTETNFYLGQTWFPLADSIEITSVDRNKNRMTVKGRYHLVSHDGARLALFLTATNQGSHEGVGEAQFISKGNGDFSLYHLPPMSGLPHVSMYDGGQPFASLYFGTRSEAFEESQASWITNAPSSSALSAAQASSTEIAGSDDTNANRPKVIFVSPADGSTNVALRQEIHLRFDQPMDPGDLSLQWVQGGFLPDGWPHYDSVRNEFILPVWLAAGRTNELEANFGNGSFGGFHGANSVLAQTYRWQFITQSSPAATAAVQPKVTAVSPPSGETLPVLTLFKITFDQPMLPPDQSPPFLRTVGWGGWGLPSLIPDFDYDAASNTFTLPVLLPPDNEAKLTLEGFKSADGVPAEPVVISCQIGTNNFSSEQSARIAAAAKDPRLEQLLSAMKAARARLTSGVETVQSVFVFGQGKSLASQITSQLATFKWQGTNQVYGDISDVMGMTKAFILGTDGENCWLYSENEHHALRLDSAPNKEMGEVYTSVADPFDLADRTPDAAIAGDRLIYAGQAQLGGHPCYRVESWDVEQSQNEPSGVSASQREWWIDVGTYLPSQVVNRGTFGRQSFRFQYQALNQPMPVTVFQPPVAPGAKCESSDWFQKKPGPDDKRFLTIIDAGGGRMSGRLGIRGPGGTTSSGLN